MPDIKYLNKDSFMAMEGMTEDIANYFIPEGQVLPVVFARRPALEYTMRIADGMLREFIQNHPEHANLKEPCMIFTGEKTLVYATEIVAGVNDKDGNPTATSKSYYLGFIEHDIFNRYYLADGLHAVRNVAQHDVIIHNETAAIHFADDDKDRPINWRDSIANLENAGPETEKAIQELWLYLILKNRRGEIQLSPQWSNIYTGAGYANFFRWCNNNGFKPGYVFNHPKSGMVGPQTCSIAPPEEDKDEAKDEEAPAAVGHAQDYDTDAAGSDETKSDEKAVAEDGEDFEEYDDEYVGDEDVGDNKDESSPREEAAEEEAKSED